MGFWSWLFGSDDDKKAPAAAPDPERDATEPTLSAAPSDDFSSSNGASSGWDATEDFSASSGGQADLHSAMGYGRALSRGGLERAMRELRVGPAELWTLINVETRGMGFLKSRLPIILFERHIFRRETGGRFDSVAPDLSNPNRGGYLGMEAEYDRLARAADLDYDGALRSASWGMGQVMGFNADYLGYDDVRAFTTLMRQSEDDQLNAVIAYLLTEGLDEYLRNHAWADLALGYNGPRYAENNYDVRLASEYQKMASGAVPNVDVRGAQVYLTYLEFSPHGVDGVFGSRTRSAVADFLTARGEPTDPDDVTEEITEELMPRLQSEAALLPDVWPLPRP